MCNPNPKALFIRNLGTLGSLVFPHGVKSSFSLSHQNCLLSGHPSVCRTVPGPHHHLPWVINLVLRPATLRSATPAAPRSPCSECSATPPPVSPSASTSTTSFPTSSSLPGLPRKPSSSYRAPEVYGMWCGFFLGEGIDK